MCVCVCVLEIMNNTVLIYSTDFKKCSRGWWMAPRIVRRVYNKDTRTLYCLCDESDDDNEDIPLSLRKADMFVPVFRRPPAGPPQTQFVLVFTTSHDGYKNEYLCLVEVQPEHQTHDAKNRPAFGSIHALLSDCPTCLHDHCESGKPPPFDRSSSVRVTSVWDSGANVWRVQQFALMGISGLPHKEKEEGAASVAASSDNGQHSLCI